MPLAWLARVLLLNSEQQAAAIAAAAGFCLGDQGCFCVQKVSLATLLPFSSPCVSQNLVNRQPACQSWDPPVSLLSSVNGAYCDCSVLALQMSTACPSFCAFEYSVQSPAVQEASRGDKNG